MCKKKKQIKDSILLMKIQIKKKNINANTTNKATVWLIWEMSLPTVGGGRALVWSSDSPVGTLR